MKKSIKFFILGAFVFFSLSRLAFAQSDPETDTQQPPQKSYEGTIKTVKNSEFGQSIDVLVTNGDIRGQTAHIETGQTVGERAITYKVGDKVLHLR